MTPNDLIFWCFIGMTLSCAVGWLSYWCERGEKRRYLKLASQLHAENARLLREREAVVEMARNFDPSKS